MNNIRSIHQFKARDTASRQIAAEQDWVSTCWQPTTQAHTPAPGSQRRTMPRRAHKLMALLGCAVLGALALGGIAVALYGAGVLLAAVVAS